MGITLLLQCTPGHSNDILMLYINFKHLFELKSTANCLFLVKISKNKVFLESNMFTAMKLSYAGQF